MSNSTEDSKKPGRMARIDADVLNRTKLLREDPSSPLVAFSHGYVISRLRVLAVLLTSIFLALFLFVFLLVIGRFEFKSQVAEYHLLGLSIYHDTIRGVFTGTVLLTIDYALLLRGFTGNKRWALTCVSGALVGIVAVLLFHWNF